MYVEVEALIADKSVQWLYRWSVPFSQQQMLYHSYLRLSWKIIYQCLFTVQMDCGFSIQFTFCYESPQVRKAKIRTAYHPAPLVSITHLSWTERRGDREGKQSKKRDRDWETDRGCWGLWPHTGYWHGTVWDDRSRTVHTLRKEYKELCILTLLHSKCYSGCCCLQIDVD